MRGIVPSDAGPNLANAALNDRENGLITKSLLENRSIR